LMVLDITFRSMPSSRARFREILRNRTHWIMTYAMPARTSTKRRVPWPHRKKLHVRPP
jgi:hypothetical protein